MKFISVIVLLALMHWTWGLVRTSDTITQAIHVGIQEDLKRIITDYIKEHLPNSRELKFIRFWTEKLGDEKVKALFVYSFEDEVDSQGAAKVEIEGHAILNKRPDETKDFEVWSFDELYISNNQVEFKEPMLVSPVKDSQSEVPATEETPVDSKGDAK